jgi:acyl-coenzyme A thioesterase PaaI-like protein
MDNDVHVEQLVHCPPGKMALESAINANHLGTKRPGGRLVAGGIPDYDNLEKQVWEVDIRDESDEQVCVARCTLTVVDLIQNPSST